MISECQGFTELSEEKQEEARHLAWIWEWDWGTYECLMSIHEYSKEEIAEAKKEYFKDLSKKAIEEVLRG